MCRRYEIVPPSRRMVSKRAPFFTFSESDFQHLEWVYASQYSILMLRRKASLRRTWFFSYLLETVIALAEAVTVI